MRLTEEQQTYITRLIECMTLEEKVSQMMYKAPAIERLGIPAYTWWNEALHGVARAGVATVFPQAIGLGATFDASLLEQVATVIAREARAKYLEFQRQGDFSIYKGLTFWSPNVNIFRDPRWGRGHETYGEDPYLSGHLGVAFIRGLQGDDPSQLITAACAKHFAVHSGPEADRHSFNATCSKKDLFETYLPAFKACVVEAQVESVMGAYNRYNDEPCCGSPYLLKTLLRDTWGFEGHIVSDCWALRDFHEHHKVTSSAVETAAIAVNAGLDLNCGDILYPHLVTAVQNNLVEIDRIDQALRRLFATRIRLGILGPWGRERPVPYQEIASESHREFAIDVARRSCVLLKNSDDLLPLSRGTQKTIGVIGPNADNIRALLGNYHGTPLKTVTVLDGLLEESPNILFAPGCHLYKDSMEELAEADDRISEAISVADHSDILILCLGLDPSMEGEQGDTGNHDASGDKLSLALPESQKRLFGALKGCGKPIILLLLTGSVVDITEFEPDCQAILCCWYPGAEGGKAIASLLFGDVAPSGKLPVTWYRSTKDLPDFLDYSMKERTYRYFTGAPLYPFGFGLTYGRLIYSDLHIDPSYTGSLTEDLRCSVSVRNSGGYDLHEVLQLYVHRQTELVDQPLWALKQVQTIRLLPGEQKVIDLLLPAAAFAQIDSDGQEKVLPGEVLLHIGGSSPVSRSQGDDELSSVTCSFLLGMSLPDRT